MGNKRFVGLLELCVFSWFPKTVCLPGDGWFGGRHHLPATPSPLASWTRTAALWRVLFLDSSAFNTIQPFIQQEKLLPMRVDPGLVAWIFKYLTDRPQFARRRTSRLISVASRRRQVPWANPPKRSIKCSVCLSFQFFIAIFWIFWLSVKETSHIKKMSSSNRISLLDLVDAQLRKSHYWRLHIPLPNTRRRSESLQGVHFQRLPPPPLSPTHTHTQTHSFIPLLRYVCVCVCQSS